jgi:hypothetical protein
MLEERKSWNALALLQRNAGHYKEALDIWSNMGQVSTAESGGRYCVGIRALPLQGLKDYSTGPHMAEHGMNETVNFLSVTDDVSLIYQYSEWVLGKNPENGLKIFTSTKRKVSRRACA